MSLLLSVQGPNVSGSGASVVRFVDAGTALEIFTGSGFSVVKFSDVGTALEVFAGSGFSHVLLVDGGSGSETFSAAGATVVLFLDAGVGQAVNPAIAPSSGGGPPPAPRRRFVYDVFRSGRTVRRPATAETTSTPAPKTAVRVVVENQASEPEARKAAKAVGRAQHAERVRGTLQPVSVAHSAQQVSDAQHIVGGIVRSHAEQVAAEAAAIYQATEEQLVISILLELGELDG
jgi:hypothetical protein